MLKTDKICVMNFENAIRGARNPMNSWARSDSYTDGDGRFVMGENDLSLASRLCAAGSDHRKFLRQIFVSVDITAPLYWWKEFDTYKVATVANSTSTMHRLASAPITEEDFSCERMNSQALACLRQTVECLEQLRQEYLQSKDKEVWYSLIQLLPSSYHQLRTCTMNYETLGNIYRSRKDHKLDEWHVFCDAIRQLPYAKELILFSDLK